MFISALTWNQFFILTAVYLKFKYNSILIQIYPPTDQKILVSEEHSTLELENIYNIQNKQTKQLKQQ